ncbi:alpha-l-rhamnosidase [Colletotrichum kahawae]|uniref:alpha-L-rhamnosidase n=1 Tax=Colletotrichum kahawae TaxID=34407 RepID=A0AAE0D4F3_COLKA|nr:alpha-l-rhamnosidase [Colletotrichum kahawae]
MRVIQMASTLGNSADVESYTSHAAAVNSSFHDAYYQPGTDDYRSSSTGGFAQTNNLLPIAFKMTSPAKRQAVIDKVAVDVVSRDNHLGTGVAGTKWLLPLLTEHGYVDLAYSVATQTTYPSWGYWKSLGATSLWEEWAGTSRSQNHPFLGTVVDWFYQHLAGIKITTAGYKSIVIAPFLPANLASAQGSIQTPLGKVVSSWTKSTAQFALTLSIPAGSIALVSLPVSDGKLVYENGKNAVDSERVEFVGSSSGRSSYKVASGTYNFVVD